jgi:hypothetical protein
MIFSRRTSCCQWSAEVVDVNHGVAFGLQHFGKRHIAVVRYVEFFVFVQLNDAPSLAVPLEFMKVVVLPAHHDLEGTVKATQLDRTGNLDYPPDRWLDSNQSDLEAVDRRRCFLRRHCNRGNQRCAGSTLIDMSRALKFSPDHPTV